jgi:hypothetical protein
MSGQCTGWVLRHGPHPDHTDRHGNRYTTRAKGLRAVLHTVADAANADGHNAHPGIEGVMRGSLYSRRRAIDLLAELVAEGWLVVTERSTGGRGRATVYSVPMVPRETVQPLQGADAGNGATATDETVQPCAGNGATVGETVQPRLHPNGVSTEPPTGNTQPAAAELAAGFERFWQAYPRAVAKGAARTAWPKAVRTAGGIGAIVDGAARFAADPNRLDKYTPHPATWLRGERWDDPPLPPRTDRPPTTTLPSRADAQEGKLQL